MTEDERDALVDEIAQRLAMKKGKAWDKFHEEDRVEVGAHYVNGKDFFCMQARELMPTINLLLAERDIDALLDSVHPDFTIRYLERGSEGVWMAEAVRDIDPPRGSHGQSLSVLFQSYTGTGPTRMDALRDAVQKAKGAGE